MLVIRPLQEDDLEARSRMALMLIGLGDDRQRRRGDRHVYLSSLALVQVIGDLVDDRVRPGDGRSRSVAGWHAASALPSSRRPAS